MPCAQHAITEFDPHSVFTCGALYRSREVVAVVNFVLKVDMAR
jgi:hypothetical protein